MYVIEIVLKDAPDFRYRFLCLISAGSWTLKDAEAVGNGNGNDTWSSHRVAAGQLYDYMMSDMPPFDEIEEIRFREKP